MAKITKSKVVVHVMVEVAHLDVTKLRKKAVAEQVKKMLEVQADEDLLGDMLIRRAVVRAVDLD